MVIKKPGFNQAMIDLQVRWRRHNVETSEQGLQNGASYPWVLPSARWEEGLWPALRSGTSTSVAEYLSVHRVRRHTGSHNLKSSWVSGVNLYFPFGQSADGRKTLADFLRSRVDSRIRTVDSVELEYAEEEDLSPSRLLGEEGGSRGSGQTSPDIAFLVNERSGLLLVENKLTEHSFYRCSARTTREDAARPANPDLERCARVHDLLKDVSLCHQQAWGRKYWAQLQGAFSAEQASNLPHCPAATAGYQLFRQQALAEAIAKSGRYEFVVSVVAIDARNEQLASSMQSSGIKDVRDWAALFSGLSTFSVFTHQDWLASVRASTAAEVWRPWADWISARYEI